MSFIRRCSISVVILTACGGPAASGTGTVDWMVRPDPTITGGVTTADGWTVTYQRYVYAIGNLVARRSADPTALLVAPPVTVIDLTQVPADGAVLSQVADVDAAGWDDVAYQSPLAGPEATRDPGVLQADYDELANGGLSQLIEATIDDGTRSIHVRVAVADDTTFHCGAGLVVAPDVTTQAIATIRGDRMWSSSFADGAPLRAGWLAQADSNGDGEVVMDELIAANKASAFSSPDYDLSGAPIAIDNAYDFVRAQQYSVGGLGDSGCDAMINNP